MTCDETTFDAGGIAEVDTRSGAAVGSVERRGLRASGAAIGSVPLAGRGARTAVESSFMRFVDGPEGLDGGIGRSRGAVAFGGGPTPSEVWFTIGDFGRVPDVERFADAPATATPEIAGLDDELPIELVTAFAGDAPGRGTCGVIGLTGVPAEGFVPPALGGPGRGGAGAAACEPAGRVARAPSAPAAMSAGDGFRPSRSAKTALIRKLSRARIAPVAR